MLVQSRVECLLIRHICSLLCRVLVGYMGAFPIFMSRYNGRLVLTRHVNETATMTGSQGEK